MRRQKQFSDMKVLLLEEDELLRGYHGLLLQRLGITCEPAESKEETIRLLQDAHSGGQGYDMCLVGWDVRRGTDTVQALRSVEIGKEIPIVCLAKQGDAEEETVLAAGADALLFYPLHQDVLYRFLANFFKMDA